MSLVIKSVEHAEAHISCPTPCTKVAILKSLANQKMWTLNPRQHCYLTRSDHGHIDHKVTSQHNDLTTRAVGKEQVRRFITGGCEHEVQCGHRVRNWNMILAANFHNKCLANLIMLMSIPIAQARWDEFCKCYKCKRDSKHMKSINVGPECEVSYCRLTWLLLFRHRANVSNQIACLCRSQESLGFRAWAYEWRQWMKSSITSNPGWDLGKFLASRRPKIWPLIWEMNCFYYRSDHKFIDDGHPGRYTRMMLGLKS